MIKLIKLEKIHLELVMNWRMKKEVTKYMFTDPILTMEKQVDWFKNIKNELYWIIEKENQPIGLINIVNINVNDKSCYCGHYIGEEGYRGIGIGKNVECNIYDYIFETLKLNKIYFEVIGYNIAAIRLHQSLGCEKERILKDYIKKYNEYHDVIVFSMEKEQWLNIKRNYQYDKIIIENLC